MTAPGRPHPEEIEQLLRNAELRDELEPFWDESILSLNPSAMTTEKENELLMSLLAWERAPSLPIARWFEPELNLPHPNSLDETNLREVLNSTILQLYDQRVVLNFADHLSDRELYIVIWRDILPCCEKRIDMPSRWLHWDCADISEHPEVYLRYYASDEERQAWAEANFQPAPPREDPPHVRRLPRAGF